MYKPNETGPWPLIDIEQDVVNVNNNNSSFATLSLENDRWAFPRLYLADTQIRSRYNSITYRFPNSTAGYGNVIGANKQIGLGIAVDGTHDSNVPYLYSISGHYIFNVTAANKINCAFITGKHDDATVINGLNIIEKNFLPPNQFHSNANDTLQGSINTSFIKGNWSGNESTYDNFPVLFGLLINNYDDANPYTLREIHISLSIERYKANTKTFDPKRN